MMKSTTISHSQLNSIQGFTHDSGQAYPIYDNWSKKPYLITGAYPLCILTGPASEMEPGVLPLVSEYTGDPIMHSTWNIALFPGS